MVHRQTIAHAPSMAKSAITLALGVAMINIFLLSNDTILAASDSPWDLYADVDPTKSGPAIDAVSKFIPVIHQVDPASVSVSLTSNGSEQFLFEKTDGNQVTEPTRLSQTYIVAQGDSLSSIAEHFKLHTASILAANEIPPDPAVINTIKPGDKLTIPAADISDSNDWLVAINAAAKKQAEEAAAEAAKKAALNARNSRLVTQQRSTSSKSTTSAAGGSKPHSGSYTYGYCTDLVAALRPDLPSNLGNANTWVSRARAQGFATGKKPAVNAAIQLAEGWVGHVAIVTSVNDSTITIRERNFNGWNVDNYRTIPIGSGDIVGYIY